MNQQTTDWILKHKQTLTFSLMFLILALSIIMISFVVYFQFFWEPPVQCDFDEYGYWGFKVICNNGFFGEQNNNKSIDQHFHLDLKRCQDSLKRFKSWECEVVG